MSYSSPMTTNNSHDPALKAWVESANDPASDFPIQNLAPCAFIAEHDGHSHGHLGVRIGESILDVSMLSESGFFDDEDEEIAYLLRLPVWTGIAGRGLWPKVRRKLQTFLNANSTGGGQQARRLRDKAVRPVSQFNLSHPMSIFNYTDFYASIHHASTVGAMFRPDNPLLPNYKYVPIGYHGRASSILVSGEEIRRPQGQQAPPDSDAKAGPSFGPCKMLDYELEVGFYISSGNELGDTIPIREAGSHIFGLRSEERRVGKECR